MGLTSDETGLSASLWQEVNRLFRELLAYDPASRRALDTMEVPPVDIWETEAEVVVGVELPGVDPGGVRVDWTQGRLTVEGEKKEEETEPGPRTYLCMERSFGSFHRVVPMPGAVDLSKATAVYRRGILTVRIPKVAEKRGARTRIAVQVEPGPERES